MDKFERKVCSIEKAMKLFKLGLNLIGESYWIHNKHTGAWNLRPYFQYSSELGIKVFPAYDVAELGMLLPGIFELEPYRCLCFKKDSHWRYAIQNSVSGMGNWEDYITLIEKTEAEVRAAALIRMIERGFLTIEKLKL